MSSSDILRRLRLFLLVLSGLILVGAVVELALSRHTQEPVQFIPFVLCGLGLIAILAALLRSQRSTLRALQVVMGLVFLGSLFGMYEHLKGNVAFELDMRPGATLADVLIKALMGAAPLLAPGMLAVAALTALAATYYHPALARAPGETADTLADPAAQFQDLSQAAPSTPQGC